jgi:hypothetical protein
VSNPTVKSRTRLLILPFIGLLVFAGQSFQSFRQQQNALKRGNTCFCWSNTPLDEKPFDTRYEVFGRSNLTSCGYLRELEAQTDLGCGQPSLPARLLMLTELPAFLMSLGIVKSLAKLGVSEVMSFIVTMPPLIFAWYYFLSWMVARLTRRREDPELATDN